MVIVAILGLPGAGKTVVADWLRERGFGYVRLGQIILDIVRERGLAPTEENERPIREQVRKDHGMAALATLNFPKIDLLLPKRSVVVDGLYSWEEYIEFKKKYGARSLTLAIYASPRTRYHRLSTRIYDAATDPSMRHRPCTRAQAQARDYAQIENLHQGGPIAMADYTLVNEGNLDELKAKFKRFAALFLEKKNRT